MAARSLCVARVARTHASPLTCSAQLGTEQLVSACRSADGPASGVGEGTARPISHSAFLSLARATGAHRALAVLEELLAVRGGAVGCSAPNCRRLMCIATQVHGAEAWVVEAVADVVDETRAASEYACGPSRAWLALSRAVAGDWRRRGTWWRR